MVALNEEFTVELRATVRDSVSTLQLSYAWNPAVISFQRLDTVGGFPPSAVSDEYGLNNTGLGKLSFVWIDGSPRGYRVPTDSFLIFKIVFKAVGANGTSSPLQFVNTPTTVKATNPAFSPITMVLKEGSVKVGTTAVFSAYTEGSSLGQNFPNPVDNQTVIPVFMKQAGDVSFEVMNLIGQKFLIEKYHFQAGRHEIRLNTAGVLPNGIFIYQLRTKSGVLSRTLIKR
jgi:hypothetical protein